MGIKGFNSIMNQIWKRYWWFYSHSDKNQPPWEVRKTTDQIRNHVWNQWLAMDILVYANQIYRDSKKDNWIDDLKDWLLSFHDISLLIIIDGGYPEEKKEMIEKRQEERKKAQEKVIELQQKIETVKNSKEKEKLQVEIKEEERKSKHIGKKERIAIIQCLNELQIPWMKVPGEAETFCAFLERSGIVYGTFTEDNDYFMHGGKHLLKKTERKNEWHCWDLQCLLESLDISFDLFQQWFMMYGSDYHKGWGHINMVTLYDILYDLKDKKSKRSTHDPHYLHSLKHYCFSLDMDQTPRTLLEQRWYTFLQKIEKKVIPLFGISFPKIKKEKVSPLCLQSPLLSSILE